MKEIAGGIVLAVFALWLLTFLYRLVVLVWWPWYEKRQMEKMSPQERVSYLCHKMSEAYRKKG